MMVSPASQRNTRSLPKRSDSRPKYVSVRIVAKPPLRYIHFSCDCCTPTLDSRKFGKYGATVNDTNTTEIVNRYARTWLGLPIKARRLRVRRGP